MNLSNLEPPQELNRAVLGFLDTVTRQSARSN